MILQVKIGENLNYTVGRLHYSGDTSANLPASDTITAFTTLCVITAVMVLIIILLVIVIVCSMIKNTKKKQRVPYTGNTDVSMYAPPAYGTHHVFTEPGLDHLYDRIDDFHEEETTKLQDTALQLMTIKVILKTILK